MSRTSLPPPQGAERAPRRAERPRATDAAATRAAPAPHDAALTVPFGERGEARRERRLVDDRLHRQRREAV
jgi:hypothetical protein